MKKENDTVYIKTFNKLGKLALASILIFMFSYAYGWTYIVPFIFGLIAMIITTSSSLAFGFVFFRDNEDIDNGVIYSKKQKILITILSLVPTLIFVVILNASHYGDIERDQICDSKEYIYKDVCSEVLKGYYVVFKYSDSQVEKAIREVKASADGMISEKSKELQLEDENRKAFAEARERRDAKKQKEEQERKTLNINININVNIPGVDVIEQQIPLKIDPSLDKDIEINVTKPVVDKSIRELMEENIISHGNDQTDDIHFEAIQNQIKNDLDLKKDYILRKEMLKHELDEMKHRNESLEDIKKNVMPYLFQAPQDNRFGDK